MTLSHALGWLDAESDYTVLLSERIRDLVPDDEALGSNVSFSYSWSGGYEVLTVAYGGGGSSEYRGSYHPRGFCETGTPSHSGVCMRCGATLL